MKLFYNVRSYSRLFLAVFFMLCFFNLPSVVFGQVISRNNSQEGQVANPPLSESAQVDVEQVQLKNNPYLSINENSIYSIPEAHILFRKKIWREIYLKELKNKPLFSRGAEITKFIIEGVQEGLLTPYTDETFSKKMTKEQFLENLSLPKEEGLSAEEKALGFTDDSGWGSKRGNATDHKKDPNPRVDEYFLPNELTTLEIMEELIFDKINSTFKYDVQAIKLIIPADKFVTGISRIVGTVKYRELAAYLDSRPKEALWVNVKNNASNIKFTEAIELRLFDSRITKMENPDDLTLADIYQKSPQHSLYAAQEMEEQLIELDNFLWEN